LVTSGEWIRTSGKCLPWINKTPGSALLDGFVKLPSFFDKGKWLSRLGNRIILQQPIFRIGMRQHCSTKEAFLERFGVAVYWINWTVCS
jgi:hypothetical protein